MTTPTAAPGLHEVPLRILRLYCDRPYTHTGAHLRGTILAALRDRDALHNHTPTPRLPPVRYVVDDAVPHLVALGEGRDELLEVYREVHTLQAGEVVYTITGRELLDVPAALGVGPALRRYRTLTPWLALNQDNHREFDACADDTARAELLSRVLVGNFLVTLRQCAVDLPPDQRIMVLIDRWRARPIKVRDTRMLGFHVELVSNIVWSPWLGVGKQVAKGFGRFVPL